MNNDEEEDDKELREKIIKDVKQCIVDGQDKEGCIDEAMKKHNLTYSERNVIWKELKKEEDEEGKNNLPENAVEKTY